MRTNNLIIERQHRAGPGVQRLYRFKNGYGASVVKFKVPSILGSGMFAGSYGANQGLWELAVIKFYGDGADDFRLTYNTPITDDVIGYLSGEEVDEILLRISRLRGGKYDQKEKDQRG